MTVTLSAPALHTATCATCGTTDHHNPTCRACHDTSAAYGWHNPHGCRVCAS